MGKRIVIGEKEALVIRRQWEIEIAPKVDADARAFKLVRGVFQRVSEGRFDDEPATPEVVRQPKRDLAKEERVWFETWYRGLGFADISIPNPLASNRDFARWQKSQSGLIFVPSISREFYEKFMTAVGRGDHWTVAHADREGIVWDDSPAANGYWLKAETNHECPRLGTSWNILQSQIQLLALLEYAILWHALKVRTGRKLDVNTWCRLRTRYKFADGQLGALHADGPAGQVRVGWDRPGPLEDSFALGGGRAAEVVESAA